MKIRLDHDRRIKLLIAVLAWLGVLAVSAACLAPVWSDWSGTVVGPFGGIDAMLQAGLVQWSASTWWQPDQWVDLPIFYPLPGSIGYMDSLLGQAWLVWPVWALFQPTAAALYNWAFLGSLLLSALGMATLYRLSGGRWWASGVAALVMLGAPYTLAQIGHLNQLPPPFVLLSFAALIAGLRRDDAGLPSALYYWLLGVFLVLQAAWGWYGFAYTVIGVAVIKVAWFVHRLKRGTAGWSLIWQVSRQAVLPSVLALVGVLILAQPQLQIGDRYNSFTRSDDEVRQGSADIKHFFNRGVYRSGPTDWAGQGKVGFERYEGRDRQVLHPGWLAIILAAVGWWRRGYISFQRRRVGRALLIMGFVGLVFSFGDSVGLPFTDKRFPLPLEWLRTIAPPFKAFRGAWRFSWLMVIALSWWSAVAVQQLVEKRGHRLVRPWVPVALVLLVTMVSLPVQVPGLVLGLAGHKLADAPESPGPVLTLPAPANEYLEDVAEARWMLRAQMIGQPVSGGATGWVPPEIILLRERLLACESGELEPAVIFAEMKERGAVLAELTLRPDDEKRIHFWRQALLEYGATREQRWQHPLYETYRLP